MKSNFDKIRVYTHGAAHDGKGAYSYIVLENKDCGAAKIASGQGRLLAPTSLKAKFAQGGKADDEMRMKMRAVYEGLRHCPDGMPVEVFTGSALVKRSLDTTNEGEANWDIASRYRDYAAAHGIEPTFSISTLQIVDDLPDNDHDEWLWLAGQMCLEKMQGLC